MFSAILLCRIYLYSPMLIDTDMLYGHRRDARGFYSAVSAIDGELDSLISRFSRDDVLIITSDHGCDPTFRGTDHTREYVPLLVYQPGRDSRNLGLRHQFSDVSASLLAFFGLPSISSGTPFSKNAACPHLRLSVVLVGRSVALIGECWLQFSFSSLLPLSAIVAASRCSSPRRCLLSRACNHSRRTCYVEI